MLPSDLDEFADSIHPEGVRDDPDPESDLFGIEFFGCDETERSHRLRVYFPDDGGLHICTVEGPKSKDQDPTEVHCLNPSQVDHLIAYCIKQARMTEYNLAGVASDLAK